jgi:hypothetical protein
MGLQGVGGFCEEAREHVQSAAAALRRLYTFVTCGGMGIATQGEGPSVSRNPRFGTTGLENAGSKEGPWGGSFSTAENPGRGLSINTSRRAHNLNEYKSRTSSEV